MMLPRNCNWAVSGVGPVLLIGLNLWILAFAKVEVLLGEAPARAEVPVKKSACVCTCRHANKNCTSDGTKIRVGGNFIASSPPSMRPKSAQGPGL